RRMAVGGSRWPTLEVLVPARTDREGVRGGEVGFLMEGEVSEGDHDVVLHHMDQVAAHLQGVTEAGEDVVGVPVELVVVHHPEVDVGEGGREGLGDLTALQSALAVETDDHMHVVGGRLRQPGQTGVQHVRPAPRWNQYRVLHRSTNLSATSLNSAFLLRNISRAIMPSS